MVIKSQFFWRTYLAYVVLIVGSIFTLVLLLANSARENEMLTIDSNLHAQAELLALNIINPTLNLDYEAIREVVERFSEASGSRFTVIDNNGVVLADSHESPFRMENHLRRPEVQEALLRGSGQALRYSNTLEQNFRYYALPVYSDERLIAVARTAFSFAAIAENIQEQQLLIIKNAAYIMFIGLVLAFYLAARQAVVVEKITNAAEVISKGDFEQRVSVNNALGLGKLSHGINQLARSSAQRVALITADRNRLATIFAGMVEGVVDVDQNQRIIHINDTAAKMLGISQLSARGKLVWEVIRDNEINQAIDQAILSQSVIKTQTSLPRPSLAHLAVPDEGIVEIYAASLSDDSGAPIGAVVVLHDVTELRNLERVRTDFVANASHELKTPITAIRGLSETILEDKDASQETSLRFMDRIHAQSVRLSELVGDLITISRLESSQADTDFNRIDMKELVERSVKVSDADRDAKNQTLTLILPEEKLEVFGDNQNLSQLVDNLINNAIKYTPEEGELKVSLFVEDADMVLEVADSGIGISPQYIQRVFERFYRVDKARSQSLGGTGLGLSIVKNIAEKHDGSVSVQSEHGKGSKFIFRMSLA